MDRLVRLPQGEGEHVTVLASAGHAVRAEALGRRLQAAGDLFAELFGGAELSGQAAPTRLLVLDEPGWRAHCPFPDYGMPYHEPPGTVYAAATDNPMWHAAMPDLAAVPPPVAQRLRDVYGDAAGVSARSFFDLLIVHELAHLSAAGGGVRFARRWLTELFCNLALHTYVARLEPEQLPALVTLPAVMAAIPPDQLPHHTLADWEQLFERVGSMAFAWYQCRLHAAAAALHDAEPAMAATSMWRFALGPGAAAEPMSDRELDALLGEHLPAVAAVARSWPGASDR